MKTAGSKIVKGTLNLTKRLAFRPEFWRENHILEAALRQSDESSGLITTIFYRPPHVLVIVDDSNEKEFRLSLGDDIESIFDQNAPLPTGPKR